jgi:type IV pilus assembly protein PilF
MKKIVVALVCVAGLMAPVTASLATTSGSTDKKSMDQAAAINTQLAVAYLKQNNLSAARDTIDKALKQNPRTAETQMTAGLVYDQLGDQKKALGHFNEAAKLGKDNPDVLNNVAVYQCRKGDRKRGEELFLKAAASPLYKTPAVAYTNAGRCARADSRPKDAEQYFRKALTYKADQPDVLQQLAEVTHELGNNMQSRAFLQRYFASAPASASMLLLGYRVETELGDAAAAGDYSKRLIRDFSSSTEAETLLREQGTRP